jgi:hypothetical protein
MICLVIRDTPRNYRKKAKGLGERLSNHLEAAFHRGSQHGIVLIVAQLLAAGEGVNVGSGLFDIP